MKIKKAVMSIILSGILILLFTSMTSPFSAFAQKQDVDVTKNISIILCKNGSCSSPCQTIILKGDTVTWTNLDSITHMIVSGSGQNGPDGWFSSSLIPPHGTFSYKFERTGAFVYYDVLHPHTQGVVIVGSAMDSSYVHLAQSFFSDWCSR